MSWHRSMVSKAGRNVRQGSGVCSCSSASTRASRSLPGITRSTRASVITERSAWSKAGIPRKRREQKIALPARLFQHEPVRMATDQESRGVAVQEAAHQVVARAAAGARYQNTPTYLAPTKAQDSPRGPPVGAPRSPTAAPWDLDMCGACPIGAAADNALSSRFRSSREPTPPAFIVLLSRVRRCLVHDCGHEPSLRSIYWTPPGGRASSGTPMPLRSLDVPV